MAHYYAIERSPEYLAHYGVKGMRWGVRKAIESNNARALDRHYKKAMKKLSKYEKLANASEQNKIAKDYDKAASGARTAGRIGLGIAAAGLGAGFGYYPIHTARYNNLEKKAQNALKRNDIRTFNRLSDKQADLVTGQEIHNRASEGLTAIGVGTAIGGYGYGAYARHRSNKAKKLATSGHKKAVADRDAWRHEMNTAFAGTKYGKKRRK